MTLRARLVLVLGSLVALLLGAEWWLVRTLTRALDEEVDVVALTVGSSMLSLFVTPDGDVITAEPLQDATVSFAVSGVVAGPDLAPEVTRRSTFVTEGLALPAFPELERHVRELRAIGAEAGLPFGGDLEVLVLQDPPSAAERGAAGEPARTSARVALRLGSEMATSPLAGVVAARGEWARSEHRFEVELGRAEPGLWVQRVTGHTHRAEQRSPGAREAGPREAGPREAGPTDRGPTDRGPTDVHSTDASRTDLGLVDAGRDFVFERDVAIGRAFQPSEAPPDTASRVRIPVPRGGLDRAVDTFLSKLLLGSIALFVVGLGAIAWVAHRVTRPLRGLAEAAARVGDGELGAVVPEGGDREVAATLRAFNGMSQRLAALDEEAQRLRDRQHLGELGDVARGLAHALRNPLHTLGLAVDVLATGRDDAAGTALAARTQIQRIDGALESFLTLAGAGGARERLALDDLARDVALELAQSTNPVAVRVLAEAGPVPVACVPAELRAVVHALVVNAAEAAPGDPVVVRVEPVADGERARLEVLDRGPGLAPEVRAKLFTPHVTTKAHGTGMGLYLAERIARTRYAGSLELHERPGGGIRAVLEVATEAPTSPERTEGGAA